MKTPSRKMPTAPMQKVALWAWPFFAAFLTGLVYWIYNQPYVLLFIGVFVVIGWFESVSEKRRKRILAASRESESICDFSRSFDPRKTDTWILRAVYEELSHYISVDGKPVPIRSTDGWEKDLKIDPEDFVELEHFKI